MSFNSTKSLTTQQLIPFGTFKEGCKHKFFPIVENQTIEKKYGLQIIICIDV